MKRGDVVVIALQGDYGKPRPALVIQSDLFTAIPSVTVLPITGALEPTPLIRIPVEPSPENGLRKTSHIMVDKTQTLPREKVGSVCGQIDEQTMIAVTRAVAVFLGFA